MAMEILDDKRLEAAVAFVSDQPESFYQPPASLYDALLGASCVLFRAAKESEHSEGAFGPLDELLVDGFDHDQIWEELQLLNGGLANAVADQIDELQGMAEPDDHDDDDQDSLDGDSADADAAGAGTDGESMSESDDSSRVEPSLSDDEHDDETSDADGMDVDEDLSALPRRPRDLDGSEDDSEDDDDDGLDGLAANGNAKDDEEDSEVEGSGDEEAADWKYADFFGTEPPKAEWLDIEAHADQLDEQEDEHKDLTNRIADLFDVGDDDEEDLEDDEDGEPMDDEDESDRPDGKVSNDLLRDDDDDEDEDETDAAAAAAGKDIKSTYEKQAARMAQEIEQLEFDAIKEKEWTLRGEVSSAARPINSLLEEDMEFDSVKKPVPIVSEDFTCTLEEMIKDRIAKREFDDVVRKVAAELPAFTPREELSTEKSKKSLAEIMEEEYMASTKEGASAKVVAALNEQHAEINKMEANLFYKLDALSNYFFTPKPVAPAAAVVTENVTAIAVEEAIPIHVSNAALQAPEEVYAKSENLMDKTEMSAAEKAALRKKAKAQKRKLHEEKAKLDAARNKKPNQKKETSAALRSLVKDKNVTIIKSKPSHTVEKEPSTSASKLLL